MSAVIRALRNAREGSDVFILGNGPSLASVDLGRLCDGTFIGMNASPLVEKRFGIVADYYVLSDARFLNNPEKRAIATSELSVKTVRVLRADLESTDAAPANGSTYYVPVLGKNGYSPLLHRGFYFGCTTMMLAIQLADYIGGRRIFLLGADFNYSGSQKRFYAEANPDPVDPFLSIQLWNIWNARAELEARERQLYLCSPGSSLEPYVPSIDVNELYRAGSVPGHST